MTEPAKRKRRRVPYIGPLFAWDLTRLARRGQDARSRTILALVLLVTLLSFTILWFPNTNIVELFFGTQEVEISESARFAEQFSLAMLIAQMAVMIMLTPAYAAGSIAEEKERRTWPYLLVTDLSNREIVLGKFCGRVVFLLGVMMAGLPVLALTALIGGIDPIFLAFGYLITGSTVVLLCAAGVTAAVYAQTFRGAMFRAYSIAALFVITGGGINPLLSPLTVLYLLHRYREDDLQFYGIGTAYFLIEMLIAATILRFGIRRMRTVERRDISRPRRPPPRPVALPVGTAERRKLYPHEADERRAQSHPDWAHKPLIGNRDPFYWKEKYTTGTTRTADDESIRNVITFVGAFVAAVLVFIVFIVLPYSIGNSGSAPGTSSISSTLIFAGIIGVIAHLLTLAPAACGTVIRERVNRTLESLLMAPEPRERILEAKWLASFYRGWWWGGPGIGCVVLGFFFSNLTPVTFAVAIYLPAVAAFCVSFGIWLSCRCTTITRALMFYLALAGALALFPLLVWATFDAIDTALAVMVMSVAALLVVAAAWVFWKKSIAEFEACGRN